MLQLAQDLVKLVHRLVCLAPHHKGSRFTGSLKGLLHQLPLRLRKTAQHIIRQIPAGRLLTNAYPNPLKFLGANMADNALNAIVSPGAASWKRPITNAT